MDGLGSVNAARQLTERFQTGSLLIDLVIGLVVGQLVLVVFNYNAVMWLYEHIRVRKNPYTMTTLIQYDTKEPLSDIRHGSQVAYNAVHEFFCHYAKSDKTLEKARLLIEHQDEQTPVSKWNMQDAKLRIMPNSNIKYKNMLIVFQTEVTKTSESKNNKSGGRAEDDPSDNKPSNQITEIAIHHNTRAEIDALYAEVHQYMTKKYFTVNSAREMISFHYYDGNNGDYSMYRAAIHPIPLQSIMLPEAQKRLLEKNLSDFKNQRGCFDPAFGNPRRLVFLIHGPPGGGKTSFIRMLISYFQMQQVKVIPSLGKFRTDYELRAMFHANSSWEFKQMVRDDTADTKELAYVPPQMFVFEEVDAGDTNHVLQNRKDKREKFDLAKSIGVQIPGFLSAIGKDGEEKSYKCTDSDLPESGLTLSTWLDVFDGLMPLENKVIVMSTNHLEYLDPAVCRKRRVTQIIHFQPATRTELMQFCQHRFGRIPKRHVPETFQASYADLMDAFYYSEGHLDRFMDGILKNHPEEASI